MNFKYLLVFSLIFNLILNTFLFAAENRKIKKYIYPFIYKYSEEEGKKKEKLFDAFGIYPYKENYFLFWTYDTIKKPDRSQREAKFQLSFMKPFIYDALGFNEIWAFGYTQQSNWQIYSHSSPFRETNYEPEFFIMFPVPNGKYIKGYRIILNHQSNGQAGDKSRSWNRIIGEGIFKIKNVSITLQAWYRIPEDEKTDDNPDIEHYLGYGMLEIGVPIREHLIKVKLRNNLKTSNNRGSIQIDWSFPLPFLRKTYFYIQYFNGYGESLIDYNRNVNKIGFGVMFSR
jgi:phospholipase A1